MPQQNAYKPSLRGFKAEAENRKSGKAFKRFHENFPGLDNQFQNGADEIDVFVLQ